MEVSDKLHTAVPHPQERATYINMCGPQRQSGHMKI